MYKRQEYGGPQPGGMDPPPPPPISGFDSPPPVWDNPEIGNSPPKISGGPGSSPGAVVFKKTGKAKDLSKKNQRKEELLKVNP